MFAAAYNFICILMLWFYVPESPKWLYEKKRYSECQEVLILMADKNGVEVPPNGVLLRNLNAHEIVPKHLQTMPPEKIEQSDEDMLFSSPDGRKTGDSRFGSGMTSSQSVKMLENSQF